jgi:hypothetical protein
MCDRVVVCYGGKLIRELKGADLNGHNLITAALNLSEAGELNWSRPPTQCEKAERGAGWRLLKGGYSLQHGEIVACGPIAELMTNTLPWGRSRRRPGLP